MNNYHVETVENPRDVDNALINDGINNFNRGYMGADNYVPISVFVRDDKWQVIGGAICSVYWNAFSVNILWLPENVRRGGLGTQILMHCETAARQHRCDFMHVDTMSFQALDFYRKFGFELFGTLPGYRGDIKRYYLHKPLAYDL